ncbi:GNAT family N-acetyltransferase [archaeon]|nr:GNAT family N-acetyltransferase [archaeon]
MSKKFDITIAKEKDAGVVASILKRHYEDVYKGYVTFNAVYVRKKMAGKNYYLIACERGKKNGKVQPKKIIGCIRASIVDIDLAELRTLCVDSEFRNLGIGKTLVIDALGLLKKNKVRKVVARAKPENKKIIKILKSLDFRKEGYFREHFRKGDDIIQFYRFLA